MKTVLLIGHAALIFTVVYRLAKRWSATRSTLYWSSFAVHLIAGMSVGLIYTFYYAANDTWLFFTDAVRLSDLAKKDLTAYFSLLADFSDEAAIDLATHDFRSIFFIKILSVFSIVTGDNYWLCTAYFSVLSFASSWFLFRKVVEHFSESRTAATIAFLLFPSVVFWSSGIEKETLTLASLYFLTGTFLQVMIDKRVDWLAATLAIFAALILWWLKYYWAGVFFISVISAVVVHYLSVRFLMVKKYLTLSYILSFLLTGIAVSFLHPNFYLHRFLEVLVLNHDAFVPLSGENKMIHFYQFNPSVFSVILNSPWALISGIFRPFPGEGQGILGLFASIENFFILILFLSFVWSMATNFHRPATILWLATIGYCIVLCIFLALSTPNFGTLSRYRVGFLPFLVFILAYRNEIFNKLMNKIR